MILTPQGSLRWGKYTKLPLCSAVAAINLDIKSGYYRSISFRDVLPIFHQKCNLSSFCWLVCLGANSVALGEKVSWKKNLDDLWSQFVLVTNSMKWQVGFCWLPWICYQVPWGNRIDFLGIVYRLDRQRCLRPSDKLPLDFNEKSFLGDSSNQAKAWVVEILRSKKSYRTREKLIMKT